MADETTLTEIIGNEALTADLSEAQVLVMRGLKGDTGEKGDKGDTGATGAAGAKGDKGDKGDRGESLHVNSAGHVIYWDEELQQWVDTGIEVEGVPGPQGADGYTPTISMQEVEGGYVMTISDGRPNGTVRSYMILNGEDGVSPAITIAAITGGHRVTITDKDHPQGQSFDVMDGEDGDSSGARLLYYFPNNGKMQWYEHPGDASLQEITGEGVSDLVLVDGFAVFVYEPGIQRVYQLTQLPDNNGRLAIFVSEGDPKLKLTMPWQNSSVTKTDITEQAQTRYFRHYIEASGVFAAHEIAYEDNGSVIAADGEDIANAIAAGIQVEILDYPLENSKIYKPEFVLPGTQVQFRSTDMNGAVSGLVVPWESSIAVPFTAIGDLPTPNAQTDLGKVPTVNANGGYSLQTPSGGDGAFVIPVTASTSGGVTTYSTTATFAEIMAHKNDLAVECDNMHFSLKSSFSSAPDVFYVFYFSCESPETKRIDAEWFRIECSNGAVTITKTIKDILLLPTVTSADNGKFLRVVGGEWAAETVPDAESNSFGGGA